MWIDTTILALLQGLTEFLPVSSSGHLTIGQFFLGFKEPDLLLDVWLHLGTLVATVAAFHQDLLILLRSLWTSAQAQDRRYIGLLVAGSIPTALIGLFFKDLFEQAFASPVVVGVDLIITGFLLLLATVLSRRRPLHESPPLLWQAVLIGTAQGLAILPGISRSGTTIAIAMLLGIAPAPAARFSFLLSLPAVAGALLLQSKDLLGQPGQTPIVVLAFGTLVAGISGYLALRWFLHLVGKGKLLPFAVYCMLLGSGFLLWLALSA